MKRNMFSYLVLIVAAILFAGLLSTSAQEPKKAIAILHPASGSQITGTVTFTKTDDGVQMVADVTGLTPGKHGFHIHEFGDCSTPDATSAGGHFNPTHQHHDGPTGAERHAGDFGNIEADASGKGHLEWNGKLKLSGEDSIVGRSVIVHEQEDDLKTDPAGNSGARIGCGVIGVAKP